MFYKKKKNKKMFYNIFYWNFSFSPLMCPQKIPPNLHYSEIVLKYMYSRFFFFSCYGFIFCQHSFWLYSYSCTLPVPHMFEKDIL